MSAVLTFADIVAIGWLVLAGLWFLVCLPLVWHGLHIYKTDPRQRAVMDLQFMAQGSPRGTEAITRAFVQTSMRAFLRALIPAAWLVAHHWSAS